MIYLNQEKWKEAEGLYMQAIKTGESLLGQEHPDILTKMNNPAFIYEGQGHWTEAENLEMQVLRTRRGILGQEHPDTLTSMASLVSTY